MLTVWTGSGANTNLKAGKHTSGTKRRPFFCSPPLFSCTSRPTRLQLVVCERFRDGQYSLVSFLFAVFFYSRCPAISKSGGHVPRATLSRHRCGLDTFIERQL